MKKKRITANIPSGLLEEAIKTTQLGITETIIQGLQLVKQTRAYPKAMALKGKLNIVLDLDTSRERNNS